jgi:ethanolamine ammonia-lyase small subunit
MSAESLPNQPTPKHANPLADLRQLTHARVGIGRHGSAMPTAAVLQFQADHALARDAVHEAFDQEAIQNACTAAQLETLTVTTQATTGAEFLRLPFAGRTLTQQSRDHLIEVAQSRANAGQPDPDVVFVISGGLSARGINLHAGTILQLTANELRRRHINIGPVIIAQRGRVGLMNETGAALKATSTAILIGERPGLTAPDSVGAYFEFAPKDGLTDADRNCISNIRPHGLPLTQGATELAALIAAGLEERLSGTTLKPPKPKSPAAVEPTERNPSDKGS